VGAPLKTSSSELKETRRRCCCCCCCCFLGELRRIVFEFEFEDVLRMPRGIVRSGFKAFDRLTISWEFRKGEERQVTRGVGREKVRNEVLENL